MASKKITEKPFSPVEETRPAPLRRVVGEGWPESIQLRRNWKMDRFVNAPRRGETRAFSTTIFPVEYSSCRFAVEAKLVFAEPERLFRMQVFVGKFEATVLADNSPLLAALGQRLELDLTEFAPLADYRPTFSGDFALEKLVAAVESATVQAFIDSLKRLSEKKVLDAPVTRKPRSVLELWATDIADFRRNIADQLARVEERKKRGGVRVPSEAFAIEVLAQRALRTLERLLAADLRTAANRTALNLFLEADPFALPDSPADQSELRKAARDLEKQYRKTRFDNSAD